jgi:uncharacterized protein (DUF2384 family)
VGWLNSTNPVQGGQITIEMIETEDGVQLVLDTLSRIEWGVFLDSCDTVTANLN